MVVLSLTYTNRKDLVMTNKLNTVQVGQDVLSELNRVNPFSVNHKTGELTINYKDGTSYTGKNALGFMRVFGEGLNAKRS